MRYYPVFLDMVDKPALIIGGGTIAHQKVTGLLDAGAKVTIISPELHDDMRALSDEGRFEWVKRVYEPGDIDGFEIVFVATDDHEENRRVWLEGQEKHIWINAVDDVPNCDFIMPGIVRKGELIVAISTSGGSPAMARKMREDIQEFLSDEDAAMLDLATEVRKELRAREIKILPDCPRCARNGNDIWNAALDGIVKGLLKEGNREAAKERMLDLLLKPAELA